MVCNFALDYCHLFCKVVLLLHLSDIVEIFLLLLATLFVSLVIIGVNFENVFLLN